MLHLMLLALFFFISTTKQQCLEESNGCLKCATETSCLVCDFGWELQITNSNCIKCAVGCMTCSSSICSKCFSGFTLINNICTCPLGKGVDNSSNTCIPCLVANCQNCSYNAEECTVCTNNFGYISSSPWCTSCLDSNCLTCKENYEICDICSVGYFFDIGTCQPCYDPYCILCSSNIYQCLDCRSGYGLFYGTCRVCSYYWGCLNCESTNGYNCTECASNSSRFISSSTNAYCITCYASGCSECMYGESYICKTCSVGFVMYENGYCSECTTISNCNYCPSGICNYCINGWVVVGNLCEKCPEGCSYCLNPTVCGGCLEFYGYNSSNSMCQKCLDVNCQECYYDNQICSYCIEGYSVNSLSICIKCNTVIDNCTSCYLYNSQSCYSCVEHENHGIYNGICDVECMGTNCKSCSESAGYCSSCFEGYIISNINCVPCSDIISECEICSGNYEYFAVLCTLCSDGYSVLNNKCVLCDNPYCTLCPLSPYECTLCTAPFILFNGNCVTCSSNKCSECLLTNQDYCTSCISGYGAQSGSCVVCSSSNCLECPQSPTQCTLCLLGLGPENGNCVACKVTNCLQCSELSSKCQKCMIGYQLSGESSCQSCADIKCSYCPISFTNCLACKSPYGLSGSNTCLNCSSLCATCKQTNYLECLTCKPRYSLTGSACVACSLNCIECTNSTYCEICDSLFYVDEFYECRECESTCTGCYRDETSGNQSCTGCITDYILIKRDSYFECKERCVVGSQSYPCSLKFGNEWDGCNDACEIEDNFNCSSPEICSYFGSITLTYLSVTKNPLENYLTIETEIFPPLFVFTDSNLLSVFTTTNPFLKLASVTFNQETGKLIFIAEILNDINNITQITIKFNPSLSSDGRYSDTSDDEYTFDIAFSEHLPYYYSPIALLAIKLLFYLSWVSVILSWLAVVLGWALRRLAGLEAIIVLQFGFVNVLWINSYLHPFYEQIWPLKYSTGFAVPFISEEKIIGSGFDYSPPFTSQFSLSSEFLLNNFNVMLGLEIFAALIALISKIILKILARNVDETISVLDRKKSKSVKRSEWIFEFSLQTFFYFTMINIVNFISCSVLWFKNGDLIHMGSIVCFSIAVAATVIVSILFLTDPDPFGYFRYSFKYTVSSCFNELAFKQYSIYEVVLIISTCLIILTSMPFVAMVLFLILTLHVLIYSPYKERKENWRSGLNLFTMCGVATIRTYLLYSPIPNHNDLILNILLIVVYGVLFTVISFLALAMTVYHYIYWKYIKPREDENNEEEIERKEKYKVYEMLDEFNLNKVVKDNPKNDNVFRKVGKSKMTLLEFSNELYQEKIETHRFNIENMLENSAGEGDGNSSARVLRKDKIHIKKLKDECMIQQTDEKNVAVHEQAQKVQAVENEKQYGWKGKVNENMQGIEKSAIEILSDENVYINLKFSKVKIEEEMKEIRTKNKTFYENAYDSIPSAKSCQEQIKEEKEDEEEKSKKF